ncbi:MAG TPA: methylated-DNA--[protein]-cysteine S-methyltransferase [Anaerolineae bacterium]
MNSHPSTQKQTVWTGIVADTPLGSIWVALSEKGLVAVSLWGDRDRFARGVAQRTGCTSVFAPEKVAAVTRQIGEYLRKERSEFDIPVDWSVLTPFQAEVLRAVYTIPYGRLLTYKDVAEQIGKPKAVRAVGRANATNPMPLVIPCHRVLGADGKLHGYSAPGGLETKAWLLRLEGSWLL